MYVNCNLKTAQRKSLFQRQSRQQTPALRWCVIVSHREILILIEGSLEFPNIYFSTPLPHSHHLVRLSHRLILIGANKWNSSIFTSPLTAQYTLIFLSDFLIDSSKSEQMKLEIPHRIVNKRRHTEDDDSGFLMFCLGWFSKVSFQYILTLQTRGDRSVGRYNPLSFFLVASREVDFLQ